MKKKNSLNYVFVGLFLTIVPNVIIGAIAENSTGTSGFENILQILTLIGAVVYVFGLCLFARAKGRSWAWGLTGLGCLVGGISVAFLKDRSAGE